MIRQRTALVKSTLALFFWCSLALAHPAALCHFEAVYLVNWHGIPVGKTTHRLRKVGNDRYMFDTRTDPFLPILPYHYQESSQYIWRENEHMIQPQYFEYTHHEGKKRRLGTVVFNWLTGKISSKLAGDPWPISLQKGVQDKLTHSLMLRYDLKHHPKKSYSYAVADDQTVKSYDFEVLAEETLHTALGPVHTVLLKHVSSKQRETRIWFAKEFDYLPVRLEQYRKGTLQTEAMIQQYTRN